MVFTKTEILAAIGLIAWHLPGAESSPYVISDDRVRSLDITPVLGRGYSIGTNSFQSTCLMVEETTVPSYNYDYYFSDFTESKDTESQMSGKVSGSFGYWGIKAELNAEATSQSKTKKSKHVVASTMRIERYYSSIKEESTDLSSDAFELLDRQDYIGFFKACGPNYVRSIRRAQEVTAIFTFESDTLDDAQSFASSLKVSAWGQSSESEFDSSGTQKSMSSSLTIKILGFGLGLNQAGSETLVASSMEEYNSVMKFAFQSMTQDGGGGQTGMVYGMEIVPWVDNTAFQVASKLLTEVISVPMPRSLIPKAVSTVRLPDGSRPAVKAPYTTADRVTFRCKELGYEIDKFGYCCSFEQMSDPNPDNPPPETPEVTSPETPEVKIDQAATMVCKPLRSLDPSVLKNNMANNGEFVALLDSAVRYKVNTMFTLEKCVTAVRSFPSPRYDFHILKSMDTVKYDATIEVKYTVAELRMAIDPTGDYSLIKHLASELDEFMDMYYSPCLAALFGTNIGTNPDTDPKYFMAESWYNHDACTKLSCLADNMRWDRKGDANGSCIPSLLTGSAGPPAVSEAGDDDRCTKDVNDDEGDTETCKYTEIDINEYTNKVKRCWQNEASGTSSVSPVYLMEHFCMPQLSGIKADTAMEEKIKLRMETCDPEAVGGATAAPEGAG